MLAGEDLIEAIEALYLKLPDGEDAPSISYVDGGLAGLLLAPRPIAPEIWLPRLRAGPEAAFADPADGARLARLLQDRQAEIAADLLEGGGVFAPVYEEDEEGRILWQLWLLGLSGALALFSEHWEKMIASDDEDVGAAAMGLMSLLATLPGLRSALSAEEKEELEELGGMAEEAPDLLPYFVEVLYRRQRGLERVIMADDDFPPPQPAVSTKVGRNEPCPCGSGKKYKKCCGG
ncbi:MAG TPA: UPF0149 family protein [Allosphingosinicella sp.]|nr:UPF0149 family protein [Allosphingosinicella sp.]